MLTYLLIWQYWQSLIRAEHASHPMSYTGHSAAELRAFQRRLAALRHRVIPTPAV